MTANERRGKAICYGCVFRILTDMERGLRVLTIGQDDRNQSRTIPPVPLPRLV